LWRCTFKLRGCRIQFSRNSSSAQSYPNFQFYTIIFGPIWKREESKRINSPMSLQFTRPKRIKIQNIILSTPSCLLFTCQVLFSFQKYSVSHYFILSPPPRTLLFMHSLIFHWCSIYEKKWVPIIYHHINMWLNSLTCPFNPLIQQIV